LAIAWTSRTALVARGVSLSQLAAWLVAIAGLVTKTCDAGIYSTRHETL
jgi:hypothetical protein